MQTALKIRTVLLLAAVLFTGLALSLPQPAQACWLYAAQECYYPNGVYCYQSCPELSWCNGLPQGGPVCYYAGDDCCH